MELYDILMTENVIDSIKENQNYLFKIIPELELMIGFDQKHPHHHLDVWNHTLLAISLSECDFEIRLALLLHDISKPVCYKEGEVRHYFKHALVSSQMAYKILKKLNFDSKLIDRICYLIRYHDSIIHDSEIEKDYELEVKRYKIQKCDIFAHNPDYLEKRQKYLEKTKEKFYKNNLDIQ